MERCKWSGRSFKIKIKHNCQINVFLAFIDFSHPFFPSKCFVWRWRWCWWCLLLKRMKEKSFLVNSNRFVFPFFFHFYLSEQDEEKDGENRKGGWREKYTQEKGSDPRKINFFNVSWEENQPTCILLFLSVVCT